jgi:hypothetical protein
MRGTHPKRRFSQSLAYLSPGAAVLLLLLVLGIRIGSVHGILGYSDAPMLEYSNTRILRSVIEEQMPPTTIIDSDYDTTTNEHKQPANVVVQAARPPLHPRLVIPILLKPYAYWYYLGKGTTTDRREIHIRDHFSFCDKKVQQSLPPVRTIPDLRYVPDSSGGRPVPYY